MTILATNSLDTHFLWFCCSQPGPRTMQRPSQHKAHCSAPAQAHRPALSQQHRQQAVHQCSKVLDEYGKVVRQYPRVRPASQPAPQHPVPPGSDTETGCACWLRHGFSVEKLMCQPGWLMLDRETDWDRHIHVHPSVYPSTCHARGASKDQGGPFLEK